MSLLGLPYAAHRGTPTPPAFRATSHATTTGATTLAVTISASAQVGDLALFVVTTGNPGTSVTPPAGVALQAAWGESTTQNWAAGANNTFVWLYTKVLVGGEPGASKTFTLGTSDTCAIACTAYSGTSGISVGPARGTNAANPGQDGGASPRLPEMYPGAHDLLVAFGAMHAYTSIANSNPLAAAPTGWTIRENVPVQANVFSFNNGVWIADGPSSKFQTLGFGGPGGNVFTNGQQDWNAAGIIALAPTGRPPADRVPVSLQGATIHAYGESLFAWVNPIGQPPWTYYAVMSTPDRIAQKLIGAWSQNGVPGVALSKYNNLAMPGSLASDICGFAYGTVASYYTRASSNNTGVAVQQAGTWLSQSDRTGLVICDMVGNDGLHDGDAAPSTSAKSQLGALNAMDAFVRLIRSSAMTGPTAGSIAHNGTWTPVTQNDVGNGSYIWSSTPGDNITITTSQASVDLVLIALDDANYGHTGATFSVTVDGNPWTTGTVSNQMKKSPGNGGGLTGAYNQAPYCCMCIPAYNMGGGTHNIVITHTGTSGQYLTFNAWLTPATTPPIVLLNKLAHYNWAPINTALSLSMTDALFDIYSAMCDSVSQRFTDGRVITYNPLESGEWDYTVFVNNQDYIHPLDKGTAFVAQGMLKALSEKVA